MKTHHEMRLRQDPPEFFYFVVLRVAGDFFQDLQACARRRSVNKVFQPKKVAVDRAPYHHPSTPPPPVPGVMARCTKFTPKQPGTTHSERRHLPPHPRPRNPPKSAQPMGGRARTSSLCPSSSSGHFGVMSASVMYRLTGECSVWLWGGEASHIAGGRLRRGGGQHLKDIAPSVARERPSLEGAPPGVEEGTEDSQGKNKIKSLLLQLNCSVPAVFGAPAFLLATRFNPV